MSDNCVNTLAKKITFTATSDEKPPVNKNEVVIDLASFS